MGGLVVADTRVLQDMGTSGQRTLLLSSQMYSGEAARCSAILGPVLRAIAPSCVLRLFPSM
jgi:hypothetical protein